MTEPLGRDRQGTCQTCGTGADSYHIAGCAYADWYLEQHPEAATYSDYPTRVEP